MRQEEPQKTIFLLSDGYIHDKNVFVRIVNPELTSPGVNANSNIVCQMTDKGAKKEEEERENIGQDLCDGL